MGDPIIQHVGKYDYHRLEEDIYRLVERYQCLQMHTIGYSVIGRKIFAVSLSHPLQKYNQEVQVRKVHWNAAVHANEWITSLILMKMIEDIAIAIETDVAYHGYDIRKYVSQYQLWIVPMVNPDGVNLVLHGMEEYTPKLTMMDQPKLRDIQSGIPSSSELLLWNEHSDDFSRWKANIRGVDLNDQFPAHWQEEVKRRTKNNPSYRDFPGRYPLSEPEAQALALFTCFHEFEMVVSLHTQGQEIYWNYRDYEPNYSLEMAKQMASRCGYQAVKLSDSDAGFKDWFIQEFRKPGFTLELGLGENPLPMSQFAQCYEEACEMLFTGLQWLVNNR